MFLVRAMVVVALGALVLPQPASAAPPSLADEVRSVMVDEHGASPLVEPSRTHDNWVFGSTTVPSPPDAHEGPRSALFVARNLGRKWRVELEGTAGFVDLARQAPREVVSDSEKDLFAKNFQVQPLADTGLGLPWPQGVAWWMGGGPHGNSGQSRPFSSIDFNGGDGRVLSAGPGKVYKSCVRGRSALVKVVHPNGFSTTYYHMYDLTTLPDGSNVQTGTYLGHIGNELPCGGSSSGAHVHFSLLRGNTHVSVNNQTIGGWTFYEGSQAYGGYAMRNGVRVNVGGRVTNYGAGTPSLPTGTVNAGDNTTVNLRSGPGLNYGVTGTVEDGAVVRIACTARGDTVQGVWGPTDLWNKLDTNGWISDGFVDTGSNDPVAPACT